jgi:solute carrier family 25 ornithine transporter 2/15
VAVGQPLDTVKVKMQTFPKTYPNAFKCFTMTLRNEGLFRGLYAGTTPSIAANAAENAVLFCAYGYCKQLVSMGTGRHGPDMTVLDKACSGFFAAFFSSFALCPTELIKCKLQALKETKTSRISATALTMQIIKTEGIRGLYNGLTSTIAREMPGYFAFFFGIEGTKHAIAKYTSIKDMSHPLVPILSGGMGGVCLWMTIFPFDLIKSRIQVENSKASLSTMLVKVIREEGFRTLYKGLGPTLLRTFPATAALLFTIEKTRMFLL